MANERPLSAGTRVTLTGTALGQSNLYGEKIRVGDDFYVVVPRSALQVVVPPEPQWTVGDAVRVTDEGDAITLLRCASSRKAYPDYWQRGSQSMFSDLILSQAWSEGRVRVLYCQKEESYE
jgi:hypothetical protein